MRQPAVAHDPAVSGRSARGWVNGAIGVVIFSASLPATRVAVQTFDPMFLTFARAAIAGLLGGALLAASRARRPTRHELGPLALVSLGVVLGFPLLSALALRQMTAAHAIVFVALLPLSTALFAVIRAGERPRPPFWAFAALGAALVGGYAFSRGGEDSGSGDALMVGAILACGLGYAEGARLTPALGGWQVISWALVLTLPVMLPLALATMPTSIDGIGAAAWVGLGYVSVFSMLVGFVFWYRGLAEGGIAAVGQLQLLQPLLGLALAAILLGEPVGLPLVAIAGAVVACVAGARRFGQ